MEADPEGGIRLEDYHTDKKRLECSNQVDDPGISPRTIFTCQSGRGGAKGLINRRAEPSKEGRRAGERKEP